MVRPVRFGWLLLAAATACPLGCRSASPGYRPATAESRPAASESDVVVPAAFAGDGGSAARAAVEVELPRGRAGGGEGGEAGRDDAAAPSPAAADANAPDRNGAPEIIPPPAPVGVTAAPGVGEVVRSVVEYFPLIEQAAAGRAIASGQVVAAFGAFDHKLESDAISQPLDFYENHRASIGVKRDTYWGGRTFAGYRIGRGVYEPWYLERETNKGGEFKAGFTAPVIRDRAIDANRSELWQAEVERTRVEAEIDTLVLLAVRDGAVAYWEWVAAVENLRIAEQVLQLGVDRMRLLEKQVELGEKAAIELVDNRRIVVSREAKLVDARRKLRQSAAKLSLFLRTPAGQPWVLPEPKGTVKFDDVHALDSVPVGQDVSYALASRPELRELSLVGRQLGIALREAANETWPDVDAGLLVGQDMGEPTSPLRDKSELELEASLTLSVPLERRKALGKYRQVQGKIAQVRAKRRFAGDKIAIEVQASRAALEAAVERVGQTREGVALADRIKTAEGRLYEAGQSNLFNLNIREQQAAEAAGEFVLAQRDYFVAEAEFAAALGLAQPNLAAAAAAP